MAGLSDYAELKLLDHVLGTTTYTKPTNVYVKLHTADPGEAGASNAFGDATRKVVTFAAAASGSASATGTPVCTWSPISASGTITHWSLWDASTGGNCLLTGALSVAKTVSSGNNFSLSSLVCSAE